MLIPFAGMLCYLNLNNGGWSIEISDFHTNWLSEKVTDEELIKVYIVYVLQHQWLTTNEFKSSNTSAIWQVKLNE